MKTKRRILKGCFNCLHNIYIFIKHHIILDEMAIFLVCIVFGIIAQIKAQNNDNWLVRLLEVVFSEFDVKKHLSTIDGYAFVVGGFSYLFDDWKGKDTIYKVYLFIVVISLLLAHCLQWLGYQFVCFYLSIANIILVLIPTLYFIFINIHNSKQLKKNIAQQKVRKAMRYVKKNKKGN